MNFRLSITSRPVNYFMFKRLTKPKNPSSKTQQTHRRLQKSNLWPSCDDSSVIVTALLNGLTIRKNRFTTLRIDTERAPTHICVRVWQISHVCNELIKRDSSHRAWWMYVRKRAGVTPWISTVLSSSNFNFCLIEMADRKKKKRILCVLFNPDI